VSPHATFTLLAVTACYAYRDIWPSMTYTRWRKDDEGPLLWVKISLAALASVVFPSLQPYQYIPFDPQVRSSILHNSLANLYQEPQPLVNPEQTASLFSFWFYTFLDPLIFKAYRMPHLSMDEFPPMADYDYTRHLIARSYKYMDRYTAGGRQNARSLFWALVLVFRVSLVKQALWLIGYASLSRMCDAASNTSARSLSDSSRVRSAPSGCSSMLARSSQMHVAHSSTREDTLRAAGATRHTSRGSG
jgi:hypothetical protein